MALGRAARHGAAGRDRLVVGMGVEEHERGHGRSVAVAGDVASSLPGRARNLTLESVDRRGRRFTGGCWMRVRGTRRLIVVAVRAAAGRRRPAATPRRGRSPGAAVRHRRTRPSTSPASRKDTIRVGGVASITNALNAPYGDIFKGAKAYFAMVNSKGGIYGRKLVLAAQRDDQMTQNLRETQACSPRTTSSPPWAWPPSSTSAVPTELAKNGIPSFGWNINADWNKPNLFGNVGALCLGCSGRRAAVDRQAARQEDDRRPRLQRRRLQEVRRGGPEVVRGVPDRQDRLLHRQPVVRRRRLQRRGLQDEGRRRRLHHHLHGHQRRAQHRQGSAQAEPRRDPVPAQRLRPARS